MDTLKSLKENGRWLSNHAFNHTSQFGEDGIISKALDTLPERNGWCIEFGAWDGRKFSNTFDLVRSKNYRGVFIEADPNRFRDLQMTHRDNRHILINAFVGFETTDCLDTLLKDTEIPSDPDLLSIDIDGNDYHVWDAVKLYRPKLVIIEFNQTISNSIFFVQPKDPDVTQGSSPAAMVQLANSKGYELIAVTQCNLLFVAKDYFPLFNIHDNCLTVVRDDSDCPQIFIGYDGHVFLAQNNRTGGVYLTWHNAELKESRVQFLPKRLQKFPDNYSRLERLAFKLRYRLPLRLLSIIAK